MKRRLAVRGWDLEWNDIRRDLEALAEVEVREGEERYLLRTPLQGVAGKVLQAVGVAIPVLRRKDATCLMCGAKDFVCPQSPLRILCFSDKL